MSETNIDSIVVEETVDMSGWWENTKDFSKDTWELCKEHPGKTVAIAATAILVTTIVKKLTE